MNLPPIIFIATSLVLVAGCGSTSNNGQASPGAPLADASGDQQGPATTAPAPDGGGPAEGGADGSAAAAHPDCSLVKPGTNSNFYVDGVARTFRLMVPSNLGTTPLPVIFNWHGLGDTEQNMEGLLSGQVNGADFPFILVTPGDNNYAFAGANLDWDIFQLSETNQEIRFFDEMLACIQKQYSVDDKHIHTVGFSNGAIVCDMIASLRGEKLGSVLTFSGGYYNDTANMDSPLLAGVIKWPDYNVTNKYAQVFLHGGAPAGTSPGDTYDLGGQYTVPFYKYAINDSAFLNGKGHDTVLCNHGTGHTAPATFPLSLIPKFFADHGKGVEVSPYRAGLPAAFPSYCQFQEGK